MRNHNGFSIMELMVVIAVIGILSAIAIPNVIAWRNNAKFHSAVRMVKVAIEKTRMTAIKTNMTARMEFTDGGDSFQTIRWNPDANGDEIATHQLPPGAFLADSNFGSDRLEFTSRGMPLGDGTLVLKNDEGNLCRRIIVSSVGTSRIADCP